MRRIWTVNSGDRRSRVKRAIGGAAALALTAGAAVAVPLLTATAADAALGSVEMVSEEVTVGAGEIEAITVGCPTGKRLAGAGYGFTDGGDDWTVARDVHVIYSMPMKDRDAKYTIWQMKVQNTGDEDHDFRMSAVCATGVASPKVFKVTAKVSSGNTASCPKDADYVGLGGGFDLQRNANFVVTNQFPSQQPLNRAPSMPNGWEHRWTVGGYRPDTSTKPEITVAILCAKIKNNKTVRSASANWTDFNDTVTRDHGCDTGWTAIAGGSAGGTSRFSARYWTNGTSLWNTNKRFWGNAWSRGNDLHPGYPPPSGPIEQAQYDNRNMFTQYVLCIEN